MVGSTRSRRLAVIAVGIALFSGALVYLPSVVFATPCGAGLTLSTDTVLSTNYTGCTANGITIAANNIVVNCNGHSLTAAPSIGDGVDFGSYTGVTVENCHLTKFGTGIVAGYSGGDNIISNTIAGSIGYGISLPAGSASNLITYNAVDTSGSDGVYVLPLANDNQFVYNSVVGSKGYGFFISGDGEMLYGNTVKSTTYYGIYLDSDSSNKITGNLITANHDIGLFLQSSTGNSITGNTASGNQLAGFYLDHASTGNYLTGNAAISNKGTGYNDSSTGSPGYPNYGTANYYYGDTYKGNTVAGSDPACAPLTPSVDCQSAQPGYW